MPPPESVRINTRRRARRGSCASASRAVSMCSAAVFSGSLSALPRSGPLRTVLARFPGTRLKQALKAQAAKAPGWLRELSFGVSRSWCASGSVRSCPVACRER